MTRSLVLSCASIMAAVRIRSEYSSRESGCKFSKGFEEPRDEPLLSYEAGMCSDSGSFEVDERYRSGNDDAFSLVSVAGARDDCDQAASSSSLFLGAGG